MQQKIIGIILNNLKEVKIMTEVKEKIVDLPVVEDLPKEEIKSEDESEEKEREKKWYEYNIFGIWPYFPF